LPAGAIGEDADGGGLSKKTNAQPLKSRLRLAD
jgi:hypothetical protein